MPNHCDNELWVVGKPADVRKFLASSANPEYGKKSSDDENATDDRQWRIFQGNYPCPLELRETQAILHSDPELRKKQEEIEKANLEKHGARHWYDWCNENWGTKWGDYDVYLEGQSRHGAKFSFTTAWAPGSAGLETISSLHPELAFVNFYEEQGCDFIGCDVFYRGKTIHSGHGTFPDGPDDWEDDEQVNAHWLLVKETREKWLAKALAKMEKKVPFHAKKFRAMKA